MSPDDPRLTAFAFGEIDDPKIIAEIELAIEQDPQVARAVEELRRIGDNLEAAFGSEPLPDPSMSDSISDNLVAYPDTSQPKKLSPAARRGRIARLEREAPSLVGTRKTRMSSMFAAIAACVVLAGVLFVGKFIDQVGHGSNQGAGYVQVDKAEPGYDERELTIAERVELKLEEEASDREARYELMVAELSLSEPSSPEVFSDVSNSASIQELDFEGYSSRDYLKSKPIGLDLTEIASLSKDESIRIVDLGVPLEGLEGVELSIGGGEEGGKSSGLETFGAASRDGDKYGGVASAATGAETSPARMSVPSIGRMMDSILAESTGAALAKTREQVERKTAAMGPGTDTFVASSAAPVSRFGIDVPSVGFQQIRGSLAGGQNLKMDKVQIESLVNSFSYRQEAPSSLNHPFSIEVELARAPWNWEHGLLRIGIRGYELPWSQRPASNLVVQVETSRFERDPEALELLQSGLRALARSLDSRDRIAIVADRGNGGQLVLPSTPLEQRGQIMAAIDSLAKEPKAVVDDVAGLVQSTVDRFQIRGGNNRVLICDATGAGDIGSDHSIAYRNSAQTVFVFDPGADELEAERLGEGNVHLIRSNNEAESVFVTNSVKKSFTIAKDVIAQIEFNPEKIQAYRIIGYENFESDHDIGDSLSNGVAVESGHHVTVLYEIVPQGVDWRQPESVPLRYKNLANVEIASNLGADDLLGLRMSYRIPGASLRKELNQTLKQVAVLPRWESASEDFRWAAAVAGFGMILRDSQYRGNTDWDLVERLAKSAIGPNPSVERLQFIQMIAQAKENAKSTGPS